MQLSVRSPLSGLIGMIGVAVASTSVQAHITLEQKEATIGGSYRASFRVPHGCGNAATTKVRVTIPEGVVSVKPMPKSGWQLAMAKGKYDKSYAVYHGTVSEGVKEVTWSGQLPNDYYDEFVLSAYLTDALVPGKMLYFPVVQECETGVNRWVEIPQDGKTMADYKEPAPGVMLVMSSAKAHDFKVGDLTIAHPWTRATPSGAKIGGGYLSITNNGKTADRLIGGSLIAAGYVEIHEMKMDGGVMKMRPLEKGLEIKPGETVKLEPGGYHLMFMDLKEPLKLDQMIKGELQFEKAGKIAVEFKVDAIGAKPAEHKH